MHLSRIQRRFGLPTVLLAGGLLALPAAAQQQKTLLILSDGVPASLNYDGPSGNHAASQTGIHNVIEPLIE